MKIFALRYSLYLVVFITTLFSCTKDQGKLMVNDEIVYTKFQPEILLNSVNGSTVLIPYGTGQLKVWAPLDTTCTTKIIVDPSSPVPFIFTAKHTYLPGGKYYNYGQQLYITSENPLDSFVVLAPMNYKDYDCLCLKYFQNGDAINSGLPYYPKISWFRRTDNAFACPEFSGDFYVAFKRTAEGKVNFGWIRVEKIGINGIKIKEAAINKAPNKKIFCGQKN